MSPLVLGLVLYVVLNVLTIERLRSFWCRGKDDCKSYKWTYIFLTHKLLRLAIYILILVQVLRFFNISLIPFVTSLSFIFAMFGFAMKDIISDFCTGLIMLTTQNVYIGSIVRISCDCDVLDTMVVQDFTAFSLLCKTEKGTDKYVRYNTIKTIEVIE